MDGILVGAIIAVAFPCARGEEGGGLDLLTAIEGVEGHEVRGEGGGEDGACCGDFRVGALAFENHFDELG